MRSSAELGLPLGVAALALSRNVLSRIASGTAAAMKPGTRPV
jgi:hypothetical protein